jgi:hypothetical protein
MRLSLLALALAVFSTVAFAENKEVTIKAGGKNAITLSVAKDAEVKVKGDKTSIIGKTAQFYIWSLPSAKSVADAVPKAGEIIKSEFVKFTVKSTSNLKVAGHEAKVIKGTGEEADDNDPGSADVVIFTDGTHVFAACVHGENDDADKQRPELLKALATVKAAK